MREGVSDAVPQVSRGSEQFISSKTVLLPWVSEKWKSNSWAWRERGKGGRQWRSGDEGCLLGGVHQRLAREECVVHKLLTLREVTVTG